MSADTVYFHTLLFATILCVHATLYLTVHILATDAAGPEGELDDICDRVAIGVEDGLGGASVDVLEREQGHGGVGGQVVERPVQVIGQQVVGPCHGRVEGHLWEDALLRMYFYILLLGGDELCSPRTRGNEKLGEERLCGWVWVGCVMIGQRKGIQPKKY